jgi:regulator of nucleoside diphosphate kinase
MNQKILHISENDRFRIQLLLTALAADPRTQKLTARLHDELARSQTVPERSPRTAGLESTIDVLDLDSGELDRFTLTLPEQANAEQGRLSILAPLGTALLGYSEGDEFTWDMPGGVRRLRIERVTQPAEAVASANS